MRLVLTCAQREVLIDRAAAGQPDEVCGLLGGRWQSETGEVSAVIPLANSAATPRTNYLVEPRAFVDAYQRLERSGDDLIGIYHSHPHGAAIPSATDVAEATWPDIPYLIIGFPGASTPDIRAWNLKRGAAAPVELVIVRDGRNLPNAVRYQ